jgi:hypothetical protein
MKFYNTNIAIQVDDYVKLDYTDIRVLPMVGYITRTTKNHYWIRPIEKELSEWLFEGNSPYHKYLKKLRWRNICNLF